MTHWQTEKNKSHKKRHVKLNRMSKKEERAFFGHGFPNPVKWNALGPSSENINNWF